MPTVTHSLANRDRGTLATTMEAQLAAMEEKLKMVLDVVETFKKDNEELKWKNVELNGTVVPNHSEQSEGEVHYN